MKKYHSLLFVPAKEKMLMKIKDLNADAYILDLEDSIEEEYKHEALHAIQEFLKLNSQMDNIFVRVNRSYMERELKVLNIYSAGFMIPKFENFDGITFEEKEILKKHRIIALIETPQGVANIELVSKSDLIDGISFGGEDYTALTNMENTSDSLFYVKSRIVMYAKAYKKAVYDTPIFELNNEDILKKDVENSLKMGFDGKMAINPKQINFINNCFKKYDFEKMKQIVVQYEKVGNAVVEIEGKIYEKMHIDRMKRILKESGKI